MTQDYTPYAEIILEIGRLCKQKKTGTLFIVTPDNRSAQIKLEEGEIVFVFFSSKRGQEALDLMSTIHDGRYRFQEGGGVSRRMQLPPTSNILEALRASGLGQSSSPVRQQHIGEEGLIGNGLSPKEKNVLENCLADCIGPMATIICEDHFGSSSDLKATIDALAGEIPSPEQVKKFREMVAERLR